MVVKQVHLLFLEQLVKDSHPFESCAILLGKRDKNEFFVHEIIPAQNKESSDMRFTIDDNSLFEIYKLAEKKKFVGDWNISFPPVVAISFANR